MADSLRSKNAFTTTNSYRNVKTVGVINDHAPDNNNDSTQGTGTILQSNDERTVILAQ